MEALPKLLNGYRHDPPRQRRRVGDRVFVGAICALLAVAGCGESKQQSETKEGVVEGSKDYKFGKNNDFFSHNIPIWERVLAPMKGKADIHYLEVGLLEGRSAMWIVDNILSHPTSRMTGIDIQLHGRYLDNVVRSGARERIRSLEGPSQLVLRDLELDSFDIIYIDGSHTADDVLADAVLSFPLLRDGGYLIFDDYRWNGSIYTAGRAGLTRPMLPKLAIDAFLESYTYYLDVVHNDYQVIVRKRQNPCHDKKWSCTPIGSYRYDWTGRQLSNDSGPVQLTAEETDLLERTLNGTQTGNDAAQFDVLAARLALER